MIEQAWPQAATGLPHVILLLLRGGTYYCLKAQLSGRHAGVEAPSVSADGGTGGPLVCSRALVQLCE